MATTTAGARSQKRWRQLEVSSNGNVEIHVYFIFVLNKGSVK